MSAWTDARDNVKQGLVSLWVSFSPAVRGFIYGLVTGIGTCVAWMVLW